MATNLAAPRPFQAMFWKEFRQVGPALSAIFICLLVAQLFAIGAAVLHPNLSERDNFHAISVVISLISPFLVVLACCGMLIGQERQANTWNWNTSLPVSWRLAFGVKSLITLLACSAILTLLLAVSLSGSVFFGSSQAISQFTSIYAAPFAGLVLVCSALVFCISALVFKDTLLSMLIGMLVLFLIQALAYFGAEYISPSLLGSSANSNADHLRYGWSRAIIQTEGLVILGLALASVFAFRWRWGTGQFSTLTLRRYRAHEPFINNAVRNRYRSPSELYALLRLMPKQSFGFRIAVTFASLTAMSMICVTSTPFASTSESLIIILAATCAFLGVSAFEGYKKNGAIRFLADRGVSPGKVLILSTLFPAILATTLVFAGLLFVEDVSPQGFYFLWCFVCGMLSAVCISKPIIACTASMILIIWSGFLQLFASSCAWESRLFGDSSPNWLLENSNLLWAFFGVPIVLWLLLSLVRKWLIEGQANFAWVLPSTAGVMLLPMLIAACTGYLWVPTSRWKGTSLTSAKLSVCTGPALSVETELFPQRRQLTIQFSSQGEVPGRNANSYNLYTDALRGSELSEFDPYLEVYSSSIGYGLEAYGEAIENPPTRKPLTEVQEAEIKLIGKRLDELDVQLDKESLAHSPEYFDSLQSQIMETTILAIHLARLGKFDESLRAMECNGQLRSLASKNSPARALDSNIAALHALQSLIDWYEFVPNSDPQAIIRALTPELEDPWNEIASIASANAAFYWAQVRGDPAPLREGSNKYYADTLLAHYFPPIKWRHERVLAQQLNEELERIARRDTLTTGNTGFTSSDALNRRKVARLATLYEQFPEQILAAKDIAPESQTP